MDAPNLDTPRMPRGGLHLVNPERLEEDVSISVAPSITKRIFRTAAVFLLLVLIGVSAALAWRSYGEHTTDMLRAFAPPLADLLPTSSSKPAAAPIAAADIQQQLASITLNLAAVKQTVEQLIANQDQLTRGQERIARCAWPFFELRALDAALQAGDVAAINEEVDYVRLRRSFTALICPMRSNHSLDVIHRQANCSGAIRIG